MNFEISESEVVSEQSASRVTPTFARSDVPLGVGCARVRNVRAVSESGISPSCQRQARLCRAGDGNLRVARPPDDQPK